MYINTKYSKNYQARGIGIYICLFIDTVAIMVSFLRFFIFGTFYIISARFQFVAALW